MKHTIARSLISSIAVGSILFAGAVSAVDWNITGFFRQEIAYSLHDDGNPNNTMGNPFTDQARQMKSYALVEQVLKVGNSNYLINL